MQRIQAGDPNGARQVNFLDSRDQCRHCIYIYIYLYTYIYDVDPYRGPLPNTSAKTVMLLSSISYGSLGTVPGTGLEVVYEMEFQSHLRNSMVALTHVRGRV